MKYKILVDDLTIDGKVLKKDKPYELPWQIGESWVRCGWAEQVEEKARKDEPPKE